MEIILTQDVDTLGTAGQAIRVNPGYARNYLFPRGMAMPSTPANMKKIEERSRQDEIRVGRQVTELTKVAEKLRKVSLTASVKVGEDDKVFGAVTSQIITDLLAEKGYTFDRREINLEEPLKALGSYDVELKLGHGITSSVQVWVVRE
ncbi:50S ribosomal protein L9 [Candidatus Neomarinimicrobiota bacterium]